MGCVYRVTCIINNKCYVGKTKNSLELRKRQHYFDSMSNPKTLFHRSLAKYGINNFNWESLYESTDERELYEKEKEFIYTLNSMFPNGYNLTTGGDGNYHVKFNDEWKVKNKQRAIDSGKKVYCLETDMIYLTIAEAGSKTGIPWQTIGAICHRESKLTLSKIHFCYATEEEIKKLKVLENEGLLEKKHFVSETTRTKFSIMNTGRKRTAESIEKQRTTILNNPNRLGHVRSEETRAKLSASRKGKLMGENNPSARRILNVERNISFNTIKEAVKYFNLPDCSSSNISSCCGGHTKTAYGYHWKYDD